MRLERASMFNLKLLEVAATVMLLKPLNRLGDGIEGSLVAALHVLEK